MKRFVIYICSLLIPLLLIMVVVELAVKTVPNSYSYKYSYVKAHGDSIQIVAIGHSQLYDGFEPKVFGEKAFNLSNSSQEFIDNYYILKELLDDMPNLKIVIMPLAYPEVKPIGTKQEISERGTYYYEYMNVDYDGQLPLKFRFECINLPKACGKLYDYYIKKQDIVGCDFLGRRNMYDFEERNFELEKNKVISKYYTLNQTSNFEVKGEVYLNLITNMLQEKNIKLVLVSTPYYRKSINGMNKAQQIFIHEYTDSFAKRNDVPYLNFQQSPDFDEIDFYDESHLSKTGAIKFTQILRETLEKF